MPRMSEARREAASLPYPRAARTRRAIASSSIAASSVSGRPSSRSCVCCAISSDQLTACASSVPPDPNRSPSTEVEREREVVRPRRVLEHPLAHVVREVQARLLVALLEAVDDAHGLVVVLEAAGLGVALAQQAVEHVLAGVAERRVPEVVAEGDRLGQVLVEAQRAGDAARDLRHLDRVGQARPEVVALVRDEDLRLVLEPAEGARVDDAVAVARVVRPRVAGAGGDGAPRAFGPRAARGVDRQALFLEPLEVLPREGRDDRGHGLVRKSGRRGAGSAPRRPGKAIRPRL